MRTRLNFTFTCALSFLLRHFLKNIAYVEILRALTSSGMTLVVHNIAVFGIVNLKVSPFYICMWLVLTSSLRCGFNGLLRINLKLQAQY